MFLWIICVASSSYWSYFDGSVLNFCFAYGSPVCDFYDLFGLDEGGSNDSNYGRGFVQELYEFA